MTTPRKTQNIFAHSPSLQILWKCAGQKRLITKALINSPNLKNIYKDVLNYVNSTNRRRSPLALILDSHLMLGIVYVYSKTVILWHQDVEKLYKDAVVHRFFEFDDSTKVKLTRKKETVLADAQWQLDIDENLLPDERILLERDFSIEIPRQLTPPAPVQPSDNLPPLPWEVSKPTHGKRITLLPDIEEPAPKFDLIDDRFGEPLPPPTTTMPMDVDERYDRTFFRAASEERSNELLRAPRVDRHLPTTERYAHPSGEQTIHEQRTTTSDLPPLPMPSMDMTSIASDPFTSDALTFITNSIDTYPIYNIKPSKTILLGVDCIPSSHIPLIFVQEPTVIVGDEVPVQMDTLPPLDQQMPLSTIVDEQVPDATSATNNEKEHFHISKKKRHTANPLNKKRKNPRLYQNIVQFDYDSLKTIEQEDEEEYEKNKREQKPWNVIVGRNGTKRMKKLLEKAKIAMTTTDLSAILDDITNTAKVLINPNETDDLIQVRRTGEELAIRRGQSSGLLPKSGARSPSSIVPTIQDRVSELPAGMGQDDILPLLPSTFDDLPLVPTTSEPMTDVRQILSPLQSKRRERILSAMSIEPSPTLQDKLKQKATEDLINAADGRSFNQYVKQSSTNRVQAARLFGILLVLCGEGRLKATQTEAYGEINIFRNEEYHTSKPILSDTHSETMESDDSRF